MIAQVVSGLDSQGLHADKGEAVAQKRALGL